jgi:hypothetical protein
LEEILTKLRNAVFQIMKILESSQMKNFKLFAILLTMLVTFSCNSETNNNKTSSTISQEQLDNIEAQLTADGYFWQSEKSGVCSAEILFRKDGTATALDHEDRTYIKGNWTFDKSMNKLQIAWEKSEQVLTSAVSVNDEGSEISFTNHIYFVCGTHLSRMSLLDKRFEEKEE